MNTGEAMETTDPKSNERTETDSEQGNLSPGAAGCDAPADNVRLEKLSAECPTHGTVPVVCPRCAGKAGGMAHRGTRSRRKKDLAALEDARRMYDASPLLQALAEQADQEERFQGLCDKLGMSAQERAEMREDMIRISLFRELAERAGWTKDERLQVLSLIAPAFSVKE